MNDLQTYGRDLQEAHEWCRKYTQSGNIKDMNQAWDLYYHVFRRISKQLPQVAYSFLYFVYLRGLRKHFGNREDRIWRILLHGGDTRILGTEGTKLDMPNNRMCQILL